MFNKNFKVGEEVYCLHYKSDKIYKGKIRDSSFGLYVSVPGCYQDDNEKIFKTREEAELEVIKRKI